VSVTFRFGGGSAESKRTRERVIRVGWNEMQGRG
jgi:hypothetical protein